MSFNQAVETYKSLPEDNKPTDDWTDEERWAFGEKYANSAQDAYAYAKSLNTAKAQEKKQKQKEAIERWSKRNWVNRQLASDASLGLNAIYGGMGYLDALAQKAAGRDTIQQNVLLPHEIANTMQGAVAQYKNEKYGTLNEDIPIIGGKGLGDVYGIKMSIAQSALSGLSGSPTGSLIQFFGMSASQGVTDALERGATPDQALALGTISGLAEAIPEMLSMDSLLGIASAEGVQTLFRSVLKQAGEEAREELTTSLINEVADRWIMGGKSNYQLRVNELVASGMSVHDAQHTAFVETVEGIAYDSLSGAISGGISGAGAYGFNRINQQFLQKEKNATAKKLLTPEQNTLIEEAKKYDTTKKRASALEKKLAEGKELTGFELRRLSSEISEASRTADVETTRKAIVDQMKSEGLSDADAKRLGEIALNKAIGNDVSKVQELMLKRNDTATMVYNQISEARMKENLGAEWAKNTPIERLRAEKQAVKENSEIKVENKPKTGLDLLKEDLAKKYGLDTKEYKLNMDSAKDKIEIKDGGLAYKKSSADSKIHTEGITSALTHEDIVELAAIEKIANELGVDIYVYESKVDSKTGERVYTDKEGNRYSDSGYYNTKKNTIHIDLRAGMNGEGTMLYTASHEVVHFIKKNAPTQYEALEKLVTAELIKGGFTIEQLVDKQKDILKQNGWDGTEENFDEVAREEMVAEACQSFLASKNAVAEIQALKTENKGLWSALKRFFTSLFTKINKIYKTVPPDSAEGRYLAEMKNSVKKIRDAFMESAVAASEKANAKTTTAEKTLAKERKSQARSISKITAEMTDAKRYEILKDKKITAPYYNGEVDTLISEELEGKINNEAKKAVVKIAEKLGIPGTEINIKDIDVDIKISRSNLKESISKDATPEQIAKLLPVLVPAVEQSILVERHDNRYYFDTDTVYFDNLLSGYVDGKFLIPVRFGLKHSKIGSTTLYVVVDQNKIVLEKLGQKNSDRGHQDASPTNEESSNLRRSVTYSISKIIPFVNSKDLLRYLPDQMLDDKQRRAKWEAIADTIKVTNEKNDAKYADYIASGNETSAAQMVSAAAKANGYTEKVYHGTRSESFNVFDEGKIGSNYGGYNAEGGAFDFTYDEEFALRWGAKANGTGKPRVIKAYVKAEKTFYSYSGKVPSDLESTIPKQATAKEKEYAMSRGTAFKEVLTKYGVDFKKAIMSKGYDSYASYPGADNIGVYSAEQIKSADTITYDDNGNVIPLSERFNESNKDIRYKSRVDKYTLKEYNSFGWARANDVLSTAENERLRSLFADAKTNQSRPPKTKSGEYMIAIGEDVDNKIAYMQGEIDNPIITRVLTIDESDETQLDKARRNIYDLERRGIQQKTQGVFRLYRQTDFGSYADFTRNLERNERNNLQLGTDRGTGSRTTSKVKEYLFDDEGNIVSKTIRHKSRSTVTSGQYEQMKANLSHSKVYSKKSAMQFVKRIAPGIRNRSFEALSTQLWEGLNSYTNTEDRRQFAKDMSEMFIDRMLVDTLVKHSEWDAAVEKMAYLKAGIGCISFREEDIPDLKYKLDKKFPSLRSRWGYKKPSDGSFKRAYGLDEFITDLSREMPGMHILAEMHPAEALIEVDALYSDLQEQIKEKYESAYNEFSDEEIKEIQQGIEYEIMHAYTELGDKTKIAKYLEHEVGFER